MDTKLVSEIVDSSRSSHITIIVKVTNRCNLNCPYCYNKVHSHKETTMSIATFERVLFNAARYYNSAEIIFHGGEPLLAGKEWYRQAFTLVGKYNRRYNANITCGIQTNGVLIDEELIQIFGSHGVSFGLSYDGNQNDNTRKNTQRLLSNIALMKKYNMVPGAIMVVTKDNMDTLIEDFELFNALGIIPKFNVVHNAREMDREDLYEDIDNQRLVERICEFFNYYALKQTANISLSYFDNLVSMVVDNPKQQRSCENIVCNYKWISVSPKGELQPCGRDWPDSLTFGNVEHATIKEAFQSEAYVKFMLQVNKKLIYCKNNCQFYQYCHGGCPATSLINAGSMDEFDLGYCKVFQGVFVHIYNYILVNRLPIYNQRVLDIVNGGRRNGRK